MYLLTVLFAPFLEEILFRGIIQKGLINKGVKPAKAIIFSALAFGIFHLNPWQTVNAFLLGLVLGVVYYKTKSLLMPILLHAFNNFISAYLLLNGNSESVTENLHLPEYYGLIVGIVLLSVSYYLFMYRNRIYYRE
ncbi:MAG: CPBP family intramembrane glutamic endopeptidase [Cloacibacterium normanense]